ncbi:MULTISPECIES: Zn-ribbon domain-containing OB-fold protein [unclassified Sphingobium]|uniref:Zn-ribbon domain-containing OB-fold protein n=1 Tax=unclassified Sphingobium TaxID=2611147 RepID=UPI0035A6CB7F
MTTPPVERIAIKEGLFAGPLDNIEDVHLAGSKCRSCQEVGLGQLDVCPNCGADDLVPVTLGDVGTLYTYTIVRHRPPGNYQGPAEFKPFGLGLVEVDGAIRVMAPLLPAINDIRIGMELRLHPYVLRTTDTGAEVVAFAYDATGEQK